MAKGKVKSASAGGDASRVCPLLEASCPAKPTAQVPCCCSSGFGTAWYRGAMCRGRNLRG